MKTYYILVLQLKAVPIMVLLHLRESSGSKKPNLILKRLLFLRFKFRPAYGNGIGCAGVPFMFR